MFFWKFLKGQASRWAERKKLFFWGKLKELKELKKLKTIVSRIVIILWLVKEHRSGS